MSSDLKDLSSNQLPIALVELGEIISREETRLLKTIHVRNAIVGPWQDRIWEMLNVQSDITREIHVRLSKGRLLEELLARGEEILHVGQAAAAPREKDHTPKQETEMNNPKKDLSYLPDWDLREAIRTRTDAIRRFREHLADKEERLTQDLWDYSRRVGPADEEGEA